MLNPKVHRQWNGIYIVGQEIGIEVLPHADGRLAVHIVALPVITGFSQACRLSESSIDYLASEIAVSDTRLDCFAADKQVPYYRVGFTIVLEPGMAEALRQWLPKLTRVTSAAQEIAVHFETISPTPFYHLQEAITNVVARIVLDGWDISHSIDHERSEPRWKSESTFMKLFDDAIVQTILNDVKTPRETS